ncbi:SAM-dependent methyltransferase [Microcoleus sp. FACHB-1515]|uniref:class I SAM-dependent methyltransferase n=1 Tax=Cyanophyceae TaxID=3028117 RepID=UPI00168A2ED1|nr:class I SAM-dependent methyltransferase [Microcoleus sp. FACHB-1515]MBD2092736.1 SAM-dependent methyltransferase [Microcoleus sp. FACHB-1515]
MGIQLKSIVPWGRNAEEYQRMFDLHLVDRSSKILDCGGGPASFNAEMTEQGYSIVSCDPLYQFSAAEIEQRVEATWRSLLTKIEANRSSYVWDDRIASPQQLGQVRLAAMRRFIQDLSIGLSENRYVVAELPNLPFADDRFDLALCSHLLLTYSDLLPIEFHLQSIEELLRIAKQVRIFPILNASGARSIHLETVLNSFRAKLQIVPYEFQIGGNQMLVIDR